MTRVLTRGRSRGVLDWPHQKNPKTVTPFRRNSPQCTGLRRRIGSRRRYNRYTCGLWTTTSVGRATGAGAAHQSIPFDDQRRSRGGALLGPATEQVDRSGRYIPGASLAGALRSPPECRPGWPRASAAQKTSPGLLCEVSPAAHWIDLEISVEMRDLVQQVHDRQPDPDQYARQQVHRDDSSHCRQIDHHRHAAVLPDLRSSSNPPASGPCTRGSPPARPRNVPQHERESGHKSEQPYPVQDGRSTRLRSRLNVGRATDDDAGHG